MNKNLAGLNSIETQIDEEVNYEVLKFNRKNNCELLNILQSSCSEIPSRERKFSDMMGMYISNKEDINRNKYYLGKSRQFIYRI